MQTGGQGVCSSFLRSKNRFFFLPKIWVKKKGLFFGQTRVGNGFGGKKCRHTGRHQPYIYVYIYIYMLWRRYADCWVRCHGVLYANQGAHVMTAPLGGLPANSAGWRLLNHCKHRCLAKAEALPGIGREQIRNIPVTDLPGRVPGQKDLGSLGSEDCT